MPNTGKDKNKPKLLLSMSYMNVNWDKGRQLHSHDFCEIMFVKEGSGEVTIGAESLPFHKGDIVVYNPGTVHTERTDEGVTCSIVFIGIANLSIDGLEPGCLCADKFAILSTDSQYDAIFFYLDRMFAEKDQRNVQGMAIYKGLLNIIIANILRLSEDAVNAVESRKTYTEVKRYIDENYTIIDSIEDLCRDMYINKYYLTHLFTQRFGISPLQYLIKKRMSLAKHILVNTDEKVDEIAATCGYNDVAYFCRVFKKQENITPLQFRKLHRL